MLPQVKKIDRGRDPLLPPAVRGKEKQKERKLAGYIDIIYIT